MRLRVAGIQLDSRARRLNRLRVLLFIRNACARRYCAIAFCVALRHHRELRRLIAVPMSSSIPAEGGPRLQVIGIDGDGLRKSLLRLRLIEQPLYAPRYNAAWLYFGVDARAFSLSAPAVVIS